MCYNTDEEVQYNTVYSGMGSSFKSHLSVRSLTPPPRHAIASSRPGPLGHAPSSEQIRVPHDYTDTSMTSIQYINSPYDIHYIDQTYTYHPHAEHTTSCRDPYVLPDTFSSLSVLASSNASHTSCSRPSHHQQRACERSSRAAIAWSDAYTTSSSRTASR